MKVKFTLKAFESSEAKGGKAKPRPLESGQETESHGLGQVIR